MYVGEKRIIITKHKKANPSRKSFWRLNSPGFLSGSLIILIVILCSCTNNEKDFDHSNFKVDVKGAALGPMPVRGGGDPDLGFIAPVVEGTSFDGNSVRITPTGKPTVILFLAHWCPHCQTEVDMLGSWIKDNPIPENVRFVSVAAAIDKNRPNYPPHLWLEKSDWPIETIVDDKKNSIAEAFGLPAFPYWIILDADGTLFDRFSGSLNTAQFVDLIKFLSGDT